MLTCWHSDILKLACWMNQLLNCKLTFCPLNVNFPPFVTFAIKEIFYSQSNFRNCVLFHPEPTNFYIQWSVYKNISWREHKFFVQETKNMMKVKAATSMWIQKTCNFQNKVDILEKLEWEPCLLACLFYLPRPSCGWTKPKEAFKIKIQRSKMPQRYRYISHSHVSDTDIKIYKHNHHSHQHLPSKYKYKYVLVKQYN